MTRAFFICELRRRSWLLHQHQSVAERQHQTGIAAAPRCKVHERLDPFALLRLGSRIEHVPVKQNIVHENEPARSYARLQDLEIVGIPFLVAVDEGEIEQLVARKPLDQLERVALYHLDTL